MYDELVKRLREAPSDWPDADLHYEAAEAIEELICEVADEHNARLDAEERQRWIPVTERLPSDFVSVQAHITDAGNFPSVREAYVINKNWFFPALKEFLPVDMWRRFDEPPKEE